MFREIALVIGLFAVITFGLSFIPAEELRNSENKSEKITVENNNVDFCDTIVSFEFDIDGQCAERFEEEIWQSCKAEILRTDSADAEMDTNICFIHTLGLLEERCIGYEDTFGITENVCLFKSMKNFKDDFEEWEK